jgi:hypothetical protein
VFRTTIITPVKPQISKFQAEKNLVMWALTCCGGSTHEHFLSESSRPYMLAYCLFLNVLPLCIGGEVITISISFNIMSGREKHMAISAVYNL